MILRDVLSPTRLGVAFVPPLGRRAWTLLAGYALGQIGTGLIIPFLIIYLHRVRGLDLGTAGLVLAAASASGVLAASAGGLIDRFGAARFVVISLAFAAAGSAGFVVGHGVLAAFVAAVVLGAGTTSLWSSVSTLLAGVVPEERRGDAFGVSYAFINLGFGTGATIGGLVLDIHAPRSFALVFLLASALFLAFALSLVVSGEASRSGQSAQHLSAQSVAGASDQPVGLGYALRDRGLLAAAGLNALFITFGFSQLGSTYPAWSTGPAGVSTSVVGLGFTANTFTIVLAQLVVLRLTRGRSRTGMTAVASGFFAVTWVIVLGAGEARAGLVSVVGLIAAPAVFGLGETLLAPSLPTLVNDLAPDALRGRYNSLFYLSWPLGSILGPPLGGFALGRGLGVPLLVGLSGACLAGGTLALKLGRFFPVAQSHRTACGASSNPCRAEAAE